MALANEISASQPSTADNFAEEIETFLQKVMGETSEMMHQARDHLRSINKIKEQTEANAFDKPANCYRVNPKVQHPNLQTIPEKASYSPPI